MKTTATVDLQAMALAARQAAKALAIASTDAKNEALAAIAESLSERRAEIAFANRKDVVAASSNGLDESVVDRLLLNEDRIAAMAEGVRQVAALDDPIGEIIEERIAPNGLDIVRRRIPLGVIGVIYESRPNVTIDIAALCIKAGNAVILRGGRESVNSNRLLAAIAKDALHRAGLPAAAVQFVDSTDRALVAQMLEMKGLIDLLVPRGGAELVRMVADNARMPAITGGIGVCHTYVDKRADIGKATAIVHNAKVQRPSVCNALDTILVHSAVAKQFLPEVALKLWADGVELRCDRRAISILEPVADSPAQRRLLRLARPDDFGQEFLSLKAAVAVVDSVDEAIEHIGKYGSNHSEAIVTEDAATAERFLAEVDASAVFANASTRFNDGGEFGLGAEIAISTGKMHAYGPMGLREITSYKWVVRGDGHIRP